MSSPLDRLEDGFEHGTVEGYRAGCVGTVCPGEPLSCEQVMGAYRSNKRAKDAYLSGLRGAELKAAIDGDASPAAGVPAKTIREKKRHETVTAAPEPVLPTRPLPKERRRASPELATLDLTPSQREFFALDRAGQDASILRRREERESLESISEVTGLSVGGIKYRLKVMKERAELAQVGMTPTEREVAEAEHDDPQDSEASFSPGGIVEVEAVMPDLESVPHPPSLPWPEKRPLVEADFSALAAASEELDRPFRQERLRDEAPSFFKHENSPCSESPAQVEPIPVAIAAKAEQLQIDLAHIDGDYQAKPLVVTGELDPGPVKAHTLPTPQVLIDPEIPQGFRVLQLWVLLDEEVLVMAATGTEPLLEEIERRLRR